MDYFSPIPHSQLDVTLGKANLLKLVACLVWK